MPADNFLSQSRVGMIRTSLEPSGARDPAQLLGTPGSSCIPELSGQHLRAGHSVGRVRSPSSVLWSSSLDFSQDTWFLPSLEKLMCQIAWGHLKC